MPSGEGAEVTLRDIAPAAFLPPAVFAVGQGAIAPVIVISATDLGASPAMAALVVALAGLGQICADIPAGSLVHRFGERPTMIGAALLTVLALVGCMVAGQLILFAAAIFVTGACTAVWLLARQAFVTEVVPYRLRARAMSTLGGVFRIGPVHRPVRRLGRGARGRPVGRLRRARGRRPGRRRHPAGRG